MINKIGLGVFLAAILLVFMVPGNGCAELITDAYYGADDHGYGDVIGNAANFDVFSMEAAILGTSLQVKINTNYSGDGGDGFSNLYTEFGDLFISTDGWDPDESQPNYLADNYLTGEDWEFAFDVSAGKLYQISATDILRSEHVMPSSGWVYRNGQEVLIDNSNATYMRDGIVYGYSAGVYAFDIDIAGLGWNLGNLGFHWTMTCGNDVIEGAPSGGGQPPVPEPATMLLLGSGLVGFAGLGRKKFSKK